ncbi:hypothetical protein, partial [Endozoicomonas sp. SESOKO3]|uniref:hypothetical protein n=1 Tax=Endozoicomonas sp. SESOKO3 TaxID=2828744 RepID=UPI00214923CD
MADQSSTVSNDLNTGKIISGYGGLSSAGGIVGTLKSNSIANNNMNTGEVTVSHYEISGGIAGEAEAAQISRNLNTGKIDSDYLTGSRHREGGYSGGIVGKNRQTLVSKNINTGSVSTVGFNIVGGIVGEVWDAPVIQNVNVGTVTNDGGYADAGGIAGKVSGGSIHDNLNAGAVTEKYDIMAYVGGIAATARYSASVYNNVNTGSVEAKSRYSHMSPAVGRPLDVRHIANNLGTFTRPEWPGYERQKYNKGVVSLSKSALKSGLHGLSREFWNAGDATQLPILKGVNTPYRDLVRINGTKQANNQFPIVLNEFADPGGAIDASSFNCTVWNGRDGYLPFPNVFSKPQTLLAGIDCTPGGFDCSGVKDNTTTLLTITLSSEKLSSGKPLTTELTTATASSALSDSTSPTTDTLSLSDNCQPPEGTPLFQTYDPESQRIYVVIQPESPPSKGIILARYKGSELDKPFGRCGIVTYTTSADHSIILDSYQSLKGRVTHENTGSQLNLVATTPSGKTALFEFPLSDTQKYPAQFIVLDKVFPESVQINDTAYHNGFMY